MTDIRANLETIAASLPEGVQLIAVSKTHSPEEINLAIEAGVTDIGENKVQEILDKYEAVRPVRWHLIGHLQTNKVKYIIDKVCLIHSVDSLKLAREIDKRAAAHDLTMDILLQIDVGREESKFGVPVEESEALLREILESCPHLRVRGLMSIAPLVEDPEEARPYFRETKRLFDKFSKIEAEGLDFQYLSMGMSHDYQVAIEEGANMVRVGSAIFGARSY